MESEGQGLSSGPITWLPHWLSYKESTCNAADSSSVSGSVRSPGGGNDTPPTPVFLPREIPWTEEPGGLQSMGSQELGTT